MPGKHALQRAIDGLPARHLHVSRKECRTSRAALQSRGRMPIASASTSCMWHWENPQKIRQRISASSMKKWLNAQICMSSS